MSAERPHFEYRQGLLGQIETRIVDTDADQGEFDQVQDWMQDPDARPPELLLPVGFQIVGTVLLVAVTAPLLGAIELTDKVKKIFSRTPQKSNSPMSVDPKTEGL